VRRSFLFVVTASRMRPWACDTAARLCVRTVLCSSAFLLVPPASRQPQIPVAPRVPCLRLRSQRRNGARSRGACRGSAGDRRRSLFEHLTAQDNRILRGAEGRQLVRRHLFRRLAQSRGARGIKTRQPLCVATMWSLVLIDQAHFGRSGAPTLITALYAKGPPLGEDGQGEGWRSPL